ncbi:LamG domain-containing protein [Rickettsiales bacterium]|nr:LamG domain-containing protein [Rickettsiales bacterium]
MNWLKRLKNLIKANGGYSLAELSISTSIIAMLAVGGLSVLQKRNEAVAVRQTENNLEVIQRALEAFIRTKNYIPCPAVPSYLETNTNFGVATAYDGTTDHKCDAGTISNETGMVPVRTLGLSDEYAYDGWERKFTYRVADWMGNSTDFNDTNNNGDIRISDIAGTNLTEIDATIPDNQGAVYVIISHGNNGYNVAWRRNDTTTPPGAASAVGFEKQNLDHTVKTYVKNKKTNNFDDIVVYATKTKIIIPKNNVADYKFDAVTCRNARSVYDAKRSSLDSYAATDDGDSSQADAIYSAATNLLKYCDSQPVQSNNPSSISGLQVWLDSADINTLYTNDDCTTISIPANTNAVGCWKDKSGNARNATQSSASFQPLYGTNVINGLPVLGFDGSNDHMDVDLSFLAGSAYTIFAVEDRTADKHEAYFIGNDGGGGSNLSLHIGYRNFGTPWLSLGQWGNDLDIDNIPSYTASPTPNIVTAKLDTSVGHYIRTHKDGVVYEASNTNTTALISANNGNVANGFDTKYYQGNIGEIIIYNKALSQKYMRNVERYLSEKWGIKLGDDNEQSCPSGMKFRRTDLDPVGACHCPDGYEIVDHSATSVSNACYFGARSVGNCVKTREAPDYTDPPSRTNMQLWVDANDCQTVILNGSKVSKWKDKSGNGRDASHATEDNQPTYATNVVGGLPALGFDGSNDHLDVDLTFLAGSSAYTIFVVEDRTADKHEAYFLGNDGGGSANVSLHIGYRNFGTPWLSLAQWGNDIDITTIPSYATSPTPNIVTAKFGTGYGHYIRTYKDGVLYDAYGGNTTGLTTANNGNIGNGFDTKYYQGNIGEIIVYNATLDLYQMRDVEEYLSNKWKIALPDPDANEFSGLVFWLDASNPNTIATDDANVADADADVTQWNDVAAAKNLYQATDANQPDRRNTLNGRVVITFDGTAETMASSSELTLSGDFSFFMVSKSLTDSDGRVFYHHDGSGDGWYWNASSTGSTANSGNPYVFSSTTTWFNRPSSSFNTQAYLATFERSGSNGLSYVNEKQIGATQTITTADMVSEIFLGADHTGANFANVDIAEIAIYNRVMSANERRKLSRALAYKWGLGPAGIVDSLAAWYDVSDASTILETNCSGATVANGGTVECIKDKSINANDLTPTGTGPTYDSGDNHLTFSSSLMKDTSTSGLTTGANAKTFFLVAKPTSGSGTPMAMVVGNNSVANGRAQLYVSDISGELLGNIFKFDIEGTAAYTQGGYVLNSWHIVTGIYKGVSGSHVHEIYLDGRKGVDGVNTSANISDTVISLGSSSSDTQDFSGDIHEVIIYDRALDAGERRKIEKYLAKKWSIELNTVE